MKQYLFYCETQLQAYIVKSCIATQAWLTPSWCRKLLVSNCTLLFQNKHLLELELILLRLVSFGNLIPNWQLLFSIQLVSCAVSASMFFMLLWIQNKWHTVENYWWWLSLWLPVWKGKSLVLPFYMQLYTDFLPCHSGPFTSVSRIKYKLIRF